MTDFDGALGTQYTLRLTVTLASQNIPANTSTLNWLLYGIKNTGFGYASGTSTPCSVTIDGILNTGAVASYDFTTTNPKLLMSGSTVVNHNADGTKTASVGGSWTANNPPQLAPGTTSGAFPLPAIPRGPQVEFGGAWAQSLVFPEVNGVWETGLMYAEYNGAWEVVG